MEALKFMSPYMSHTYVHMQVLASQLHFLATSNVGLAIPSLFWQVNCIKIEDLYVALLSGPTQYSLYCATYSCMCATYSIPYTVPHTAVFNYMIVHTCVYTYI